MIKLNFNLNEFVMNKIIYIIFIVLYGERNVWYF